MWLFLILDSQRIESGFTRFQAREAGHRAAVAGEEVAGEVLAHARITDEELDHVFRVVADLAYDVVLLPVLVGEVMARDAAVLRDLDMEGAGAPAVVVELVAAVEVAHLELLGG